MERRELPVEPVAATGKGLDVIGHWNREMFEAEAIPRAAMSEMY